MTGRELIKKILDAKVENVQIEIFLDAEEVLIPYDVEVSIREEGIATYAETPWRVEDKNSIRNSNGAMIAIALATGLTGEYKANAEFIVKACNSHEELVDALRIIKCHATIIAQRKDTDPLEVQHMDFIINQIDQVQAKLEAL